MAVTLENLGGGESVPDVVDGADADDVQLDEFRK